MLQSVKNITPILLFVSSIIFSISSTNAQSRSAGDVGIGLQVGQPSGLSIATYQPTGMGLDLLAAWDLNDFLFLNAHGIFTTHIGNSNNLHFFYGPGAFIGVRNNPNNDNDDVAVGISGTAGLSLIFGTFEIYGRVTPRLELIKSTNADIGGGIGFRVYLL